MERPAGGFGGLEGGQTAGLNALKNRWLGRVAARVAVERLAGGFGACSCESCRGKACGRVWRVWGFEGGQTAGLNALKNRWLGRVAARVAVERPAGGFGACSCESCLGKACARGGAQKLNQWAWP